MLVTTKVKVNRFCSVLEMFTKVFSYQRAEAIAPRLLLPLRPCNVSPLAANLLDYSTPGCELSSQLSGHDKLLDERRAEVLDGRRLLPREPELVGQAGEPHELGCLQCCGVGLEYVVEWPVFMHALSTSPAPRSGALCHGRPP